MVIVQIIGLLGFVFLFLSFLRKTRARILIDQIISYIFYSVHYLLLNAQSGYIISVFNLVKCLFLTIKDNHKWLQKNYLLFIFIIGYIFAIRYTYQDVYSLLPGIGAIINMSMQWQGTVKEMRIGGIINSILWVIYNIHVVSYVGTLSDSSIIVINVIMLIRMCKNDKINKGKISASSN